VDIFVTKSEMDQSLNFDEFTDLSELGDVSRMTPDELLKVWNVQFVNEARMTQKQFVN
jgi:negative regulator of genetic competence, sporulation and motility